MARARRHTSLPPPYLKRIWLDPAVEADSSRYPFCLPLFKDPEFELRFERPVTIIVGENGTGKSTLLEGIAVMAGFPEAGGGQGYRTDSSQRAVAKDGGQLVPALRGSWLPKIGHGWFFRAESFFSVARYLDEAALDGGFAPPDYLSHSHGEGFLRFFGERCSVPGLFLFDEPESALSPNRQFDFLKLLHRLDAEGMTQIVVATHSPIIMALPGAQLLRLRGGALEPVSLEETDHFRLLSAFTSDWRGTVEAMLQD
ncbi:AAA family ATPase [Sphingosinicella sp. CPCC 101087]|uniref:AAA family ATPase n=1 Tax=Sphingosinicella sp. CPCC 101087 TaxID=2497754 RepID=UPI00101CB529|nr:AAA family ATPase [Sphingosinicella sp. CPCC 101087]